MRFWVSEGRDRTDGLDESATGGKILYVQPGCRLYVKNFTAAVGVKLPIWTEFTFSTLF